MSNYVIGRAPTPTSEFIGHRFSSAKRWGGGTISCNAKASYMSGFGFGPLGYRRWVICREASPSGDNQTLYVDASDLGVADTFDNSLYPGGYLLRYRKDEANLTYIPSKLNVLGAKIGRRLLHSGANRAVASGESFTHTTGGIPAANATYHYRIVAIAADGTISANSTDVSETIGLRTDNTSTPTSVGGVDVTHGATGGTLPAPTNVTAVRTPGTRSVVITADVSGGAVGYLVYGSWEPPANHAEKPYLLTEDSAHPHSPDDLYIFVREQLPISNSYFSPRAYHIATVNEPRKGNMLLADYAFNETPGSVAEWVAYDPISDAKPSNIIPGLAEHYLRITATNGVVPETIENAHGGTAQSFNEILEPGATYKLEIVMRANRAIDIPVTVSGVDTGATGTLPVGTSWALHTHSFGRDTLLTSFQAQRLNIFLSDGSDSQVEIAWYRIAKDGQRDGAPHPIWADAANGIRLMRWHGIIKLGNFVPTIPQLLGAYGATPKFVETFADQIKQSLAAGCREIHLQLDPCFELSDYLKVFEFLYSPSGGAFEWANQRAALGFADPVQVLFPDGVRWEPMNEPWTAYLSGAHAFWGFPGTGNSNVGRNVGMFYNMFFDYLRDNFTHWSAVTASTEFAVSCRVASNFGQGVMETSRWFRHFMHAGYTTGRDVGGAVPITNGESFTSVLTSTWRTFYDRLQNRAQELRAGSLVSGRDEGADWIMGMYEAGPGLFVDRPDGMEQATWDVLRFLQECWKSSRALGTATVGNLLSTILADHETWNYFTLNFGDGFVSHAPPAQGGRGTFAWYAFKAMDARFRGWDMRIVTPVRAVKHESVVRDADSNQRVNAQMAALFINPADPTQQGLVVCNFRTDKTVLDEADPMYDAADDGRQSMTIDTGWRSVSGLQYYDFLTGSMRSHMRYPAGQRLTISGYVSDSTCIATPDLGLKTALTIPEGPNVLTLDGILGVPAGGLRGGNAVIILASGVNT